MRFELAGSITRPAPLVLTFTSNQAFAPQQYIDAGYTDFDVICIGAGGGMGGGVDTGNVGTGIRNYGGAGGGGGLQRVQGLLSALPASCPIVVGAGGAVGAEHPSDPTLTGDGYDGGYSSFNTTTCRASGGRGGKRSQSNSSTVATQANGGDGGIGGSTAPGGGAAGGTAGTPSATGPGVAGTNGADGTWNGQIGSGGGGGAGGVGLYGSKTTCNAATSGGRGSFNAADTSVYGPSDAPDVDPYSQAASVVPGGASGARAAPVNGLPTVYGYSQGTRLPGANGVVTIRLTAE